MFTYSWEQNYSVMIRKYFQLKGCASYTVGRGGYSIKCILCDPMESVFFLPFFAIVPLSAKRSRFVDISPKNRKKTLQYTFLTIISSSKSKTTKLRQKHQFGLKFWTLSWSNWLLIENFYPKFSLESASLRKNQLKIIWILTKKFEMFKNWSNSL